MSISSGSFPTILIIPTGIGCEVGGYGGDAIPVSRLIASASGCLITHPNVMNAASLYWRDEHIHYVEGFAMNSFAKGEIYLKCVRKQKVGLLIDKGLTDTLKQHHLNVANACRASLGLDIGPIIVTDTVLNISLEKRSSGASWGGLANPDSLLRAGEALKRAGVGAIAIVTRFPDEVSNQDVDEYRQGSGVDILSGGEAVISHLLVKHLGIPCAHSPAMLPLPLDSSIDPRAASEEIGFTFLPSVLVGLSQAPELLPSNISSQSSRSCGNILKIDDVGAVIAPQTSIGGECILACIERKIPIILVGNSTVLNVELDSLGLDGIPKSEVEVYKVSNYIEAAGVVMALKEGILVDSLLRPISRLE